MIKDSVVRVLAVSISVLVWAGIVAAQDFEPVEPLELAGGPIMLAFNTAAAGPPTVELLTDGRLAFRITATGEVSGTLDGSITAQVSEVTLDPSPPFHPITVMFTIETEQGMIEGYYTGSFNRVDGPGGPQYADVSASGQILSVSGAYADLYLADVFVTNTVQYEDGRSVGDSGTMAFAAR